MASGVGERQGGSGLRAEGVTGSPGLPGGGEGGAQVTRLCAEAVFFSRPALGLPVTGWGGGG